ncbi:MAG TPA: serine--tRNA ligase [Gammaproteobacteria bacterium]|nr:serine--tRNA ligase [Gammaproteobacteria bacterium]
MLDPKKLRNNFEEIAQRLQLRGKTVDLNLFNLMEESRKKLQIETQELQSERNKRSKEIGVLKSKGEDVSSFVKEMESLRDSLNDKEQALNALLGEQENFFLQLPNIPHASVPEGHNENANVEVRRWGNIPEFDFPVHDHIYLGELHQGIDFQTAALLSGSRFVVLKGAIAKLHRALAQWMLDTHCNNGYQEVNVPFLVEEQSLFNAGQLPKFYDDLFHLNGERKLSLIPTAEVPLANLLRDQIIDEKILPLKFVSHTPCFRSEAGSYGKDTKGMIRQHQFEKVELFHFVHPTKSYEALEQITQDAETILQKLNLPYRVVSLCTGDLGFCASKTYDLEVWLPGQNKYREISSCSNTEDFQARRLKARFRSGDGKPELLHTLNGSGLAIGRTLIAVLENYQLPNGDIKVPDVLIHYMNGLHTLKAQNPE